MRKRKDPAAVALGRKGGKARLRVLTPERRSEIARHANLVRYGKGNPPDTQPGRWYGLLLLPADYRWHGTVHAAKVLDAAHARPEIVLWSPDRAEVVERSKEADLRNRTSLIIDVDYDPTGFIIQREYKPEVDMQLKALRVVLDAQEGGGQR